MLAGAALRGQVGLHRTVALGIEVRLVDLHFVKVEAGVSGQLDPHVAGRLTLEVDCQRFAVGVAVEDGSVVLIDPLPSVSVLGEQNHEPRSPASRVVASVVDVNLIQ